MGRVESKDEARSRERAAIMYGTSRKTRPLDDRGEASTSVIVERRARNVMLRRHDAATSIVRSCERSVSGAWRSGIIARWSPASCCRRYGGGLRKRIVRAVMRPWIPSSSDGRITDRDEQRRALKESSPAATGASRSSMRGSESAGGKRISRKGDTRPSERASKEERERGSREVSGDGPRKRIEAALSGRRSSREDRGRASSASGLRRRIECAS